MTKPKSLLDGIGSISITKKYYDDWSKKYDQTLDKWKYQAPKKSAFLLKQEIKIKPDYILDLACGTGLFGIELKKLNQKSKIYGSDISYKSIKIAKQKKIYDNLEKYNFENKHIYKIKFDLVSMIGSMTYCKNFDKLFENVKFYLKKKGIFIFSHRLDLWLNQDFDKILQKFSKDFKILNISRPYNYLPLNKDFKNKIKIRIVLLQKC